MLNCLNIIYSDEEDSGWNRFVWGFLAGSRWKVCDLVSGMSGLVCPLMQTGRHTGRSLPCGYAFGDGVWSQETKWDLWGGDCRSRTRVPGVSLRASQQAEEKEPEETGKRSIQGFVRKIRKMSYPGGKQRQELRGKEATIRVKCCWEVKQNEARELAVRVSSVGTMGCPALVQTARGGAGGQGGLERSREDSREGAQACCSKGEQSGS